MTRNYRFRLPSLFAFAVIAGFVSVIASADEVTTGVYGNWGGLPEMTIADGVRLVMTMELSAGKVTANNQCKFADGVTVAVSASSAAVYTRTTIATTSSSQNRAENNGHSCDVNIGVGQLNYQVVDANHLTLSANGQSFTLSRISQ